MSVSVCVCISCYSKLDEDNLYMAYADIMAKVPATDDQFHSLEVN